jgi:hypothetical protein
MNKRILWLDQHIDGLGFSPYLDEFTHRGYVVVKARNPDECEAILEMDKDFVCIISSIALYPLGESMGFYRAQGGIRAGVVLMKRFLKLPELSHIPKVLFGLYGGNVKDLEEELEFKVPFFDQRKYVVSSFIPKIERIIAKNS